MADAIKEEKKTLSDRLRVIFKDVLDAGAGFLNGLGLHPNTVTLIGLAGHIAAAYLLAIGQMTWGGILILIMAPIDVLDGAMARLKGSPTSFGAFLDSVTDRYEELILLGGLLIYYLPQQNWTACILIYLAAAGSLLVSYVRSRAEAFGFTAKIGLLSRFERYLVLIPALVFNRPLIALWILAIFTNFTALQRIFYVRRQFYAIKLNH